MNELIDWTELQQVLQEYADEAQEMYKYQISIGGKNASRKLIDNVTSQVVVKETSYVVTLKLQDYWKYIESGRKAGKFPPVGAIMRWIEVKPIIPRPNEFGRIPTPNQLAFLIGRKIKEEGIEPYPALKTTREELDKLYHQKISAALGKAITQYVIKMFG